MSKTFVFIDTWFVKQDINKRFINTIQFCIEDLKMKRSKAKLANNFNLMNLYVLHHFCINYQNNPTKMQNMLSL